MYVNISLLNIKLTAIQSSHTGHYSVTQKKHHISMIGIHLIVSLNYSNWNQDSYISISFVIFFQFSNSIELLLQKIILVLGNVIL